MIEEKIRFHAKMKESNLAKSTNLLTWHRQKFSFVVVSSNIWSMESVTSVYTQTRQWAKKLYSQHFVLWTSDISYSDVRSQLKSYKVKGDTFECFEVLARIFIPYIRNYKLLCKLFNFYEFILITFTEK